MIKDNPARVDPPEYEDADEDEKFSHEEICNVLSDPQVMWEALGPNGIELPYLFAKGLFLIKQNEIRIEQVEQAIMLAIVEKDKAALGDLLYDQAISYAEKVLEVRS